MVIMGLVNMGLVSMGLAMPFDFLFAVE